MEELVFKIASMYYGASLLEDIPKDERSESCYWFYDNFTSKWLGVPKSIISQRELSMLGSTFHRMENETPVQQQNEWYLYLFEDGKEPTNTKGRKYRYILFYWEGEEFNRQRKKDIMQEMYLKSCFIHWINNFEGVIIQEFCVDDDLSSASVNRNNSTLNIKFYFGVPVYLNEKFNMYYNLEKNIFKNIQDQEKVGGDYRLEEFFPLLLTRSIDSLEQELILNRLEVLREDTELCYCVKGYIESGLNIATTAKALFLHRNTVVYRLEKFVQKTGLDFKNFSHVITIYFACLLIVLNKK